MEIYKINKDDKNSLKSLVLDYLKSDKGSPMLNHSFWADKLSLFSKEELGFDADEFIDKRNRLNSFKHPISDPTKMKTDSICTRIDWDRIESSSIDYIPQYLPIEEPQTYGTINRSTPYSFDGFYGQGINEEIGYESCPAYYYAELTEWDLLGLQYKDGSFVLNINGREIILSTEWLLSNHFDDIIHLIEDDDEFKSLLIKSLQKANERIRREYFGIFHSYEFCYTYKPIFKEKHEYIDIISTLKENEGFTGGINNLSLTIKLKKISYGRVKYYYSSTS